MKIVKKFKQGWKWLTAKKIRLITALLVLTVVGVVVWIKRANQPTTQTKTTMVAKGTIVSSVTASGQIIASNINNITTQASGTVKKVYVNDGDKVYQGQILAEIELDLAGAQNHAQAYASYQSAVIAVNSANNNLRSAQASAEKVLDEVKGHDTDETLTQKETRTKAEVARDNAYDTVGLAKVKLTSATLDYQSSSPIIRAPASGMVKSLTIAEGVNIGATENSSGGTTSQRVATIASEGLPLASFNVSEIDVTQIKINQKATITLDSIADTTFTGKVVSVDRIGSISSNVTTYPVIIRLDSASEAILPNMAATAKIIITTKNEVLIVPTSAVQTLNNQSVVKVMVNQQEQTVVVETGIADDSQTEITSGLKEGDVVIISTISTIQTNQRQNSGPTFFESGHIPGGMR